MYSRRVILIAAKASFLSIAWPVVVIGTLSLFAVSEFPLIQKAVFLFGFEVVAWVVFFAACLLIHRYKMRDAAFRHSFLSKDEKGQGQELGTYLEGW